jgi:hypothetical protein
MECDHPFADPYGAEEGIEWVCSICEAVLGTIPWDDIDPYVFVPQEEEA